jgi:hypothetical protein
MKNRRILSVVNHALQKCESERRTDITATIKRIVTRWALPALALIAGGFVCDGLTEFGHHAFLIAGGIALGIGIGSESRGAPGEDCE